MKKITLIIVLFSTMAFYAQQHRVATKVRELTSKHTAFTPFSPLSVQANANAKEISKVVNNATFVHLDKAMVKQIAHTAPQFIELAIPYNGAVVTMQLYRAEVFAQGFHADTDKQKGFNYNPGAYYRGIIKGNEASLVSFSFFEDELYGTVSSGQLNNLVVAHLPKERDRSSYIIYSDSKLSITQDFSCGSLPGGSLQPGTRREAAAPANVATGNCVTVYYEIDNDIYLQNNSNQVLTGNWITAVFNNVQTLYDNDGITVSLKSFMVWTTPDNYSGSDSADYLTQFFTAHVSQAFDGDVGQLISIDPGSLGGVAVLRGLCDTEQEHGNVSYIDINDLSYNAVPLYSWTVECSTHEMGHLLGSGHTHDCSWNGNNTPIDSCGTLAGFPGDGECTIAQIPEEGGTIMSYCHLMSVGINLANGFGPQPAQRIQNFVNSAQCLGTACAAEACHNFVTGLFVTNPDANTATVSWEDESAGPWEISYGITGTIGSVWQQATATDVTLNGLLPNTYYTVAVRPVCTGGTAPGTEVIFATAADWCMGQQFTDPSGDNQFYGLNQDVVRTLTPDGVGQKIKVNFTSFALEEGYDFLEIYDGHDMTAPLIGTFTGYNPIGEFTSTAADGALTFHFTSDDQVASVGWLADVSCQAELATTGTTFTNFSYYPNPAANRVTITAGEPVNELKIYNAAGQLLLVQQVNATNFVTDISSFAAGVYFFKASGDNKAANFTIIKY